MTSILAQARPEGGIEVIVADGMSDDGTREVLAEIAASHPEVRVIDNPGRIVSKGLNLAIAAARGAVIVRMDVHCEYAPDYVLECLRALEASGADNVGGPCVAVGRGYIGRAIAAAFHSAFCVGGARWHRTDYEGPVDTICFGAWRRDSFRRFGPFDEELVRNQDDEHNLRILRGGGRVWQSPRIRSTYHPRGSLPALFRQYMQYGYWKVRVIRKHRLPASWRHLVPGAFVAWMLVTALLTALCALGAFALGGDAARVSGTIALWTGGAFAGAAAAYAVAAGLAAIVSGRRAGWDLAPVLPLVFLTYHAGYGWGFLRGLLDACRGAGVPAEFTALTRGARSRATDAAI